MCVCVCVCVCVSACARTRIPMSMCEQWVFLPYGGQYSLVTSERLSPQPRPCKGNNHHTKASGKLEKCAIPELCVCQGQWGDSHELPFYLGESPTLFLDLCVMHAVTYRLNMKASNSIQWRVKTVIQIRIVWKQPNAAIAIDKQILVPSWELRTEEWRKLVVKSTVVPQRSARLRDR